MKSGFVVCLTCCCTKNCCDVGSSLKSKQVKLLNQQHFQWTLVQWNSPNSATRGQKFSLKRINNETKIMKWRYFFWTWLQFCYNAKTGPTDPTVGRWRSGLKPPKTSFKNQMSSFPVSHPHLSRFSLVTSCLFSPGLRVQHVLFSSSSSEWHVDLFKRHILNVPLSVWPKILWFSAAWRSGDGSWSAATSRSWPSCCRPTWATSPASAPSPTSVTSSGAPWTKSSRSNGVSRVSEGRKTRLHKYLNQSRRNESWA